MPASTCCCCFSNATRYLILLLATLCLTSMLSNILTLNFTVICMTEKNRIPVSLRDNSSLAALQIRLRREITINSTDSSDFGEKVTDEEKSTVTDSYSSYLPSENVTQDLLDFVHTTALDLPSKSEIPPSLPEPQPSNNPIETSKLHDEEEDKQTTTEADENDNLATSQQSLFEENREEFAEIVEVVDFDWSPQTKSILFAAIAVGALITVFPVTWLIQQIGARKVFAVIGFISAVSTALCPLAARLGVLPFIIVRAIQGIGFAACFPIIGAVTAQWATLREHGMFMGMLTSFIQLAPVFTMPLAGMLCVSEYGWPAVYYIHAIVTALLFIVWAIFYRDRPHHHPWVTGIELNKIVAGKAKVLNKRSAQKVPYGAILRTPSVWAVWVAAIGNMFGIQMVILYAPTFLKEVLKQPIIDVGFLAALPTLVQFVVKLFAGYTSDRVKCKSETVKVCVYNSIALLGMAAFLAGLALVLDSAPRFANAMLICSVSILGFNTGGFFKSATLIARHHSQFVMGNVQLIMCIAMLVVPLVVTAMTPTNAVNEWQLVFFSHAALLAICNIVFCIFGSGLAASWASANSWNEQETKKMALIDPIDFNEAEAGIIELRVISPKGK